MHVPCDKFIDTYCSFPKTTARDGINKRKYRLHCRSRVSFRLNGFVRFPMYVAAAGLGSYHFVSEPWLEIPLVSFAFIYSYFRPRLGTLHANSGRLVRTS